MKLKKYNNTPDWETAISIFLFVEIIINKKESLNVSLDSYQTFELLDTHIEQYNAFVLSYTEIPFEIKSWLNNRNEIEQFRNNFGAIFKQKVTLWSDRTKTDYFKEKLQLAFEFENYIERLFKEKYNININPFITPEGQYLHGENEAGIEIKNDTLISKYDNIYFEYAEKSKEYNATFVNSGILKDDKMHYFLIGDRNQFWIFRKARLVEIFMEEKAIIGKGEKSQRGVLFKEKKTSLGSVFPVKFAANDAITIQTLVDEIKRQ